MIISSDLQDLHSLYFDNITFTRFTFHVLDLTTCKATEEELFKFEMHLASYLVF